jgi:hypothetical protein
MRSAECGVRNEEGVECGVRSAGVRECGSAGVRECGSAGVRECGSAGVRECGSAGVRNAECGVRGGAVFRYFGWAVNPALVPQTLKLPLGR